MKKILILLMILANIFLLVSCGTPQNDGSNKPEDPKSEQQTDEKTPEKHTHEYEEKFDETYHWSECSCNDIKDKEEHSSIDNENYQANVCSTCGAVFTENECYANIKSIGVDPSQPHNAYQVLIYSYYDADGDGYGDLAGLESKLEYIKELGCDIIWLSPIMESESYHAYDITSFYRIDSKIGTIDDYLSLVDTAHSMDMKIVLDMPINHTSLNHEWFIEYLEGGNEYYQEKDNSVNYGTSSSMGDKAKFYTAENGKTYFAAFGETMPDLNYQSEELQAAIYEVFDYWMNLGTDGFRFDAVKHLYDPNEIPAYENSMDLNNQFFQEIGAHLKEINEYVYLLGENFSGQTEVKEYAESFDAEFDFELWHISRGAVCGFDPWWRDNPDCRAVRRREWSSMLVNCTNELIDINPSWIPTFMTSNHDVDRPASWIGDRVEDDLEALKLYAAMCTLRQGIPFIYYGDEVGMYGENKSGDYWVEDSQLRLPMNFSDSTIDLPTVFYTKMTNPKTGVVTILGDNMLADWPNYNESNPNVEESIDDPNSLYHTYKDILAYRMENPVIALGTMEKFRDYKGQGTIISFTYEEQTVYVAYNFSETELEITDLCPEGDLEIQFVVNYADTDGTSLYLDARGVAVFTCESGLELPDPTSGPDYSTKYNLVINGEIYYALTHKGDAYVDGVKHDEYFATGIQLNSGDVVTLYDTEYAAEWAITNVNKWSTGNCVASSTGITVGDSGNYDIYVQFLYENDKIYFGPAQ